MLRIELGFVLELSLGLAREVVLRFRFNLNQG